LFIKEMQDGLSPLIDAVASANKRGVEARRSTLLGSSFSEAEAVRASTSQLHGVRGPLSNGKQKLIAVAVTHRESDISRLE
jgi:hypothetical protein